MPPAEVLDQIDTHVDPRRMEEVLMAEGVAKFADPFKKLLQTISKKRASLTAA
jgi:transaldolase